MRGNWELRNGSWRLRVYAGIDPATGTQDYLRLTLSEGTGKRERDRQHAALLARADELAAARRHRRREGGEAALPERARPKERTVADALEAWWKAKGKALRGPSTARIQIDAYLTPRLGHVALWRLRGVLVDDDPDLVDLSALYDELLAGGAVDGDPLKPASVHRAHGVLRSALSFAVANRWLKANPASDARLPRIEDRECTTPDIQEMAAFLPYLAARHEDLHLFALLVASGPRPQEAAALRWSHIDLAAGTVGLTGEGVIKVKDPGQPERHEVKRGETEKRRRRSITLDPLPLAALRSRQSRQRDYSGACRITLGRQALVFTNDHEAARPIAPHAMTTAFDRQVRYAVRDGLSLPGGMRLYDMRHFGITQLLAGGVDPAEVARRFGTSARMIYARYAHAVPTSDTKAAAVMANVWGPQWSTAT